MKKHLIILLFASLLFASAQAQTYTWPDTAGKKITQTFSNLYVLSPLSYANDSTIALDSTIIATRLRLYKTIDSMKAVYATLYVPLTRTITTSFGLTGGGDLSADRTFKVDSFSIATRARVQKAIDSLGALIAAAGGGGGQADSTYFWSRNLNAVGNGDKFGATTFRSLNFYSNNTRFWQFDSLGSFNIFPGTSPKSVMKWYRNGSTSVVVLDMSVTGDEPVFNSGNAAYYFKRSGVEFFRIDGGTALSQGQGAITSAGYGTGRAIKSFGTIESEVTVPSSPNVNNGFQLKNTTAIQLSLGLNSSSEPVIATAGNDIHVMEATPTHIAGDLMKIWAANGGVHIKTKGTYTQNTAAILNVESINRGFLGPRMTTTQRDNMVGSILSATLTYNPSGYTNGTYTGVSATGGTGSGATFDVVISGGQVSSVNINNPGTGYTNGNALTISSGTVGGVGITVTVNSPGVVGSIPEGLMIYNLTTHKYQYHDGTSWVDM